ncbi:MAG: hypothetical protein V4549_10855 [Bacteroidota bacterium]
MKTKANHFLFCILFFSLISCKKDVVIKKLPVGCDPSNSVFNQLYTNLVSISPNQNSITMDLETHTYSFEVSSAKTICMIGYQSLPSFSQTPYLIEVFDSTSNTLLYNGNHIFSPNSTSYYSITPIALVVGHSYTIRRIQTNWAGNIGNTIGRLVHSSAGNIAFPVTFGDLKITGSSSYGTGGPHYNWGLPYIDIVFE